MRVPRLIAAALPASAAPSSAPWPPVVVMVNSTIDHPAREAPESMTHYSRRRTWHRLGSYKCDKPGVIMAAINAKWHAISLGHEKSDETVSGINPNIRIVAHVEGVEVAEWRWRESNPRPSVPHQGFSGRSLLCFSQPRRSHRQATGGLSRCE